MANNNDDQRIALEAIGTALIQLGKQLIILGKNDNPYPNEAEIRKQLYPEFETKPGTMRLIIDKFTKRTPKKQNDSSCWFNVEPDAAKSNDRRPNAETGGGRCFSSGCGSSSSGPGDKYSSSGC